ncbi:MAG: hypothetical protein AAFR23_10210, partial [Pseudomonadota bacterium]
MATIDAAAKIRVRKPGLIAALLTVSIAGAGLAGCSANGNLLDVGAAQPANPAAAIASPKPATGKSRVAIAPVIGAPDTVAQQLSTQLKSQLGARGVSVVDSGTAPDYTIRGYMVAAKERSGTKVSYIWDVNDPKGARVNRISGEEVITGSNSRDPWVSVSPLVIGQIAQKTATSLGAWLPSQRPARAAAPAVAGNGTTPVPTAAVSTASTPPATPTPVAARPLPSTPASATGPVSRTATGSIPRSNNITVVRPKVTGAPGDGSTSLARALSTELTKNGVALTPAASASTYRVDGKVAMGSPVKGKQAIQIDWTVTDPRGQKLGTVSQKNDIPA